jgi:hypothetical protein
MTSSPATCLSSIHAAGAVRVAAGLLASCADRETPEAGVRAVIAAGEEAAEARDLSGILDYVSPAFKDGNGGGRDELKQYLRGYLVTHQSVHLVTRVESMEFPYRDHARVQLKVGTLGREAADTAAFDLAADIQEVVLELQLEDDEWKVVRAAWDARRRD